MAYGTGVQIPGYNPKPKGNDPYKASIVQGGQDYDDIMKRYRNIYDRGPTANDNDLKSLYGKMIDGPKYTPQTLKYNRGPELTGAFNNLSEYSRTGGISGAEEANIRARGVSPIRSVYANAQQNLSRNRALGSGYSPNFAASSAKMTRDLSENLANATTNVEAGIAQQRQQGRLQMAPQYADFANRETNAMGDIDKQNEDNRLRAAEMSRATQMQGIGGLAGLYGQQEDRELKALGGMSGMYSSAPGMAQLYGQQAATTRGLDQQDQQIANQSSSNLMNAYNSRKPAYKRQPGTFQLG